MVKNADSSILCVNPLNKLKLTFIHPRSLPTIALKSSVDCFSGTEDIPLSNGCHFGLGMNLLDVNYLPAPHFTLLKKCPLHWKSLNGVRIPLLTPFRFSGLRNYLLPHGTWSIPLNYAGGPKH